MWYTGRSLPVLSVVRAASLETPVACSLQSHVAKATYVGSDAYK